MISFLAISLLAFSSCMIGYFLANSTKSELRQGKRYFLLLKILTLFLLSLLLFYRALPNYLIFLIAFILGNVAYVYFKKEYFVFAVVLFLFSGNELILLAAFLIFIYGLINSSLIYPEKKFVSNLLYFIIPLVILLTGKNLVLKIDYILAAFCSGFLFNMLLLTIRKLKFS